MVLGQTQESIASFKKNRDSRITLEILIQLVQNWGLSLWVILMYSHIWEQLMYEQITEDF